MVSKINKLLRDLHQNVKQTPQKFMYKGYLWGLGSANEIDSLLDWNPQI